MDKTLREKLNEVELLTQEKASTLEASISDLADGITILTDVIYDIPKSVDSKIAETKSEIEKKISNIKVKNGKNGMDGVDGIDGKDGKNGKDGLNGKDGKDGSPDKPEDIVNKLESLSGINRLKATAIQGIEEFVKLGKDGYPKNLPQPAASLTYQLNGTQVGRGNILNIISAGATASNNGDTTTYTINGGTSLTGTPTEVVYFDASGNPTSDSLFTSNATTKARVAARTTTQIETPVQFDGTGANDLTYDASGITTVEPISFEVTVTVGDPTSPNKFSWTDSNGGSGSNITILPGLAQTLSNGVDITFASATGHDTNDIFSFSITPSTTTGFYTNDDVIGFGYPGSGVKTVATDGAYNFNGVLNIDSGLISGQVYSDALGDYFTAVASGKGYYSIQVSDIVAGNQVQAQFRDGIVRFAVNDGTSGTLQLDSAGLLINDAWRLPTEDALVAGYALLSDASGQSYWGSAVGTPALNEYYIGFGSGSNLLTGSSSFTFDGAVVSVGSFSNTGSYLTLATDGSNTSYGVLGIQHKGVTGIPPSFPYTISGAPGIGTDENGGNITIETGRQRGNATGPIMDFVNTFRGTVSGTTLATQHVFLRSWEENTIIGDIQGLGSLSTVTINSSSTSLQANIVSYSNNIIRGDSFHNSAVAQGSSTEQDIRSGTYTPTVYGVNNVTSASASECQWSRVGNVVTVSGKVTIEPTANNTSTSIYMTKPVDSSFTQTYQAGGTGMSVDTTAVGHAAAITAETTFYYIKFAYHETHGTASEDFTFSYTYLVV